MLIMNAGTAENTVAKRVFMFLLVLFLFYVAASWFIREALGIDQDPLEMLREIFIWIIRAINELSNPDNYGYLR
ncbi:MAG: hypothetical protein ACREQA_19625 [Candidatus Binatia bacterium]